MSEILNDMSDLNIPQHISIIMDGNGRWAQAHGEARSRGHIEGVERVRDITEACVELGVRYLSLYTFSEENWTRPKDEVDGIMTLFRQYLDDLVYEGENRERVRLRFIGDRTRFSGDLLQEMEKAERETADNTEMTLNIAINYGGRDDIVHAVKSIVSEKVPAEEISESLITERLYTAGLPEVDLIIRPSGEQRLSNFLIWQAAYAEYVFMDVLWPDFSEKDLDYAISEYAKRNRRFGGV